MAFEVDGNRVFLEGEIDADTQDDFEDILEDNPNIDTLVLQYIGGSVDDEANVEFGRFINELGLKTVVPSDGLVASGGTDLFLAGKVRLIQEGACIGVHSWAAEDFTATDLPKSDREHDRYLDYYDDIDVPERFYWFTIEAAPADGMHWMSAGELASMGLLSLGVSKTGRKTACDRR